MDSICYVYWLHRPCQIDMLTEGYIGITNKPNLRLQQHLKAAKSTKSNHRLYNSLNKYTDFIMEILVISSREQCLALENKLRPLPGIGLNTTAGGSITNLRDVSNSTKEKLSKAAKQAYQANPDLVKRCGKSNTGRVLTQEHRRKISESCKSKQRAWENSLADTMVWLKAEEFYVFFIENPNTGYPVMSKTFGLATHKTKTVLKMFRSGWNPFTDIDYQNYKERIKNADHTQLCQ